MDANFFRRKFQKDFFIVCLSVKPLFVFKVYFTVINYHGAILWTNLINKESVLNWRCGSAHSTGNFRAVFQHSYLHAHHPIHAIDREESRRLIRLKLILKENNQHHMKPFLTIFFSTNGHMKPIAQTTNDLFQNNIIDDIK